MGWTRDVSRSGLCVESASRLRGDVYLELEFPRLLAPIPLDGRVVWQEVRDEKTVYGVRLAPGGERFADLLSSKSEPAAKGSSVLLVDSRITAERRPCGVSDVMAVVPCARSLAKRSDYDCLIVDATMRDELGVHVLSELLVGRRRQNLRQVVALVRDADGERFARSLGADGTLARPEQCSAWVAALDASLRYKSRRVRNRIGYL